MKARVDNKPPPVYSHLQDNKKKIQQAEGKILIKFTAQIWPVYASLWGFCAFQKDQYMKSGLDTSMLFNQFNYDSYTKS